MLRLNPRPLHREQVMNARSQWICVVVFCCVLCSCATVKGLKTDVTSTYEKVVGTEDEKVAVFYVSVASLNLYPEPRFSKHPVAVLQRNEKVLRYKLSKGFAYVKVLRTGEVGWLNNSSLDWKRAGEVASPTPQQPDESMPQGAETESEAPTAVDSTTAEDSREGSLPDSAGSGEAEAAPDPPAGQPDENEKSTPKASLFDSF